MSQGTAPGASPDDAEAAEAFRVVLLHFRGDRHAAVLWWATRHHLLGHRSPRELVAAGKSKLLLADLAACLRDDGEAP